MPFQHDLTIDNIKLLDLQDVFLNRNILGNLVFENSFFYAEKLQKFFVELQELNYEKKLTTKEVDEINVDMQTFLKFLHTVAEKNPEQDQNFNVNVRNELDTRIIRYVEDTLKNHRNKLIFLRQEIALSKPESRELQKEKTELAKLRKEYQDAVLGLKLQLEKISSEKNEIESSQGEVAALRFGKHFETQAGIYTVDSSTWLHNRDQIINVLIGIIIVNFCLYLYLFIANKVGLWPNFPPSEFFTFEYAFVKISFILLLSHLLAFNSKNYSITKNLEVKNKHRKNVADTMVEFLASNPDADTRSQIIRQGSQSMFVMEETGYLGKMNEKDNNPIEQINYFLPNKG
jgi:hypothetical protein